MTLPRPAQISLLFAALFLASVLTLLRAHAQTAPPPLSQGELEQLVAPVALYPDELLAEVLAASTYPLEVVEAQRWLEAHKDLSGDALKSGVQAQGWDDSVKSLAATPSVIQMMSDRLDWTQKLGDAVLAGQGDVMTAAQRLRTKAYAQKTLKSTAQQKVIVKQAPPGPSTIIIEPAQPQTVYVPYYDPAVVYGAWPYPAYPPYYYPPPPGYAVGTAVVAGIAFGITAAIWSDAWHGGFDWGHGNININNINVNNVHRNGFISGQTRWTHNPAHRQGVRYNNPAVQQRYGRNLSGATQREAFRGRALPGAQARPAGQPLAGRTRQQPRAAKPNFSGFDRAQAQGASHDAFSNLGSGRAAQAQSARGRESFGGGGRQAGGARGGGPGRRR